MREIALNLTPPVCQINEKKQTNKKTNKKKKHAP